MLVESEGFVAGRVVWGDLWGARREEALRRLAREHARARAPYGDDLTPEQARFAEAMAGVRARRLRRDWRADATA